MKTLPVPANTRSACSAPVRPARALHAKVCSCFVNHNVARKQSSLTTGHILGAREHGQFARGPQPVSARQRRDPVIEPAIIIGKGEEREIFDLYEYLLRQRIIFVGEYITDKVATRIVASLLALEQLDENAEIRMYLNSPGGSPYSVFGVVDAVQSIKPPVSTVGLGTAYSYSSILLGAGTKGRRFATKNCRMMMTMPMGGSEGSHFAIERTVQELNALYQMQLCYYKKFTNLSWEQLEEATVRDFFFTPEEARQIGLVDEIIRGPNDYFTPPSIARQMVMAGLEPPYNPGPGSAGIPGWTGRMG